MVQLPYGMVGYVLQYRRVWWSPEEAIVLCFLGGTPDHIYQSLALATTGLLLGYYWAWSNKQAIIYLNYIKHFRTFSDRMLKIKKIQFSQFFSKKLKGCITAVSCITQMKASGKVGRIRCLVPYSGPNLAVFESLLLVG